MKTKTYTRSLKIIFRKLLFASLFATLALMSILDQSTSLLAEIFFNACGFFAIFLFFKCLIAIDKNAYSIVLSEEGILITRCYKKLFIPADNISHLWHQSFGRFGDYDSVVMLKVKRKLEKGNLNKHWVMLPNVINYDQDFERQLNAVKNNT